MGPDNYLVDGSAQLADLESQILLLNDALSSGNLPYLVRALGVVARARGMSELARDAGVSREKLFQALEASSEPDLCFIAEVIKALSQQLKYRSTP